MNVHVYLLFHTPNVHEYIIETMTASLRDRVEFSRVSSILLNIIQAYLTEDGVLRNVIRPK